MTRWTTTYTQIAHATEETISDDVRKAHWAVFVIWLVTILSLFLAEYGQEQPDASAFLGNAAIATTGFAALYLALVGLRWFAHRRPHAWHLLNWSVIWVFLLGATAYFLATEGIGTNAVTVFLVFLCVYAYRWLMHHATFEWETSKRGVTQKVSFLGHTQSYSTGWKEVKGHRVHPLSGAVELKVRGNLFHLRPRVHLIVPDQKHRKKIHAELARILWHPRAKKHVLTS